MGTGAISPGLKRPGREADNSLPSFAEVNNDANIIPLSIRLQRLLFN
jgi:hypothetical protein